MLGNQYSQSITFSRLIATGLTPSEAAQISRLIQKWVTCNGEEETVRRLKSLKDAFVHHLAGLPYQLEWIAHREDGKPKGPFGVLWKFSRKQLFKCWNALMVYSSMTYSCKGKMPRMTARQYSKFIRAVNRNPVDPNAHDMATVLIENFLSVIGEFPKFTAVSGVPVISIQGSPSRRAPDSKSYMGSAPQDETLVSSIAVLSLRPRFTLKHWKVYSGVLTGFEDTWELLSWTKDNSTDRSLSGRIGIIQEPGYKSRVVANPYMVHQAAMLPLKHYLLKVLRSLPNDYVYNQEGGVRALQEKVDGTRTIYSVDLVNASDNLPLSLQEYLLKRIGIPDYWVDCFCAISSGDWEMPSNWIPSEDRVRRYLKGEPPPRGYYPWNGDEYLRWYEGQPLGLGPSFGSAFLLHHAIVVGCHVALNKPLDYGMVGDDLFLTDGEVYKLYCLVMDGLGVEVSKDKSLVSSKVGEFLSRIVTPHMVLRGYKWKGSGDNSFVDVARSLGPRSLPLFRRRQQRVLKALGELPEPYGLGWNSRGRSWWDRMEEWLEAFERLDVSTRSFETTTSSLNRKLYTGTLQFTTDTGYPVSAIPDQGIEDAVSQLMNPTVAPLGHLMLPNLDYVARLLDDVPCPSSKEAAFIHKVNVLLRDFSVLERACDITQLIRYERLLFSKRSV